MLRQTSSLLSSVAHTSPLATISAFHRLSSSSFFTPSSLRTHILPTIPATTLSSPTSPTRSFRPSSPHFSAPPPPPPVSTSSSTPSPSGEAAPTFSSIVASHGGWYPLIGMGATYLLAKEVIIWDPELLMVTNFAAVVFIAWTFGSKQITDMVAEDITAKRKSMEDHHSYIIEVNERLIKAYQMNIDAVDVLKEIKNEYNTLVTQVVNAKEMKARQSHRDSVMARLQALKQREDSEKSSYQTAVYDKTLAHVRKAFAALPKQQKDVLVDYAVGVIGGDSKQLDAKVDPVKKLFKDYLNSKAYEKEIEAERAAEKAKLVKA